MGAWEALPAPQPDALPFRSQQGHGQRSGSRWGQGSYRVRCQPRTQAHTQHRVCVPSMQAYDAELGAPALRRVLAGGGPPVVSLHLAPLPATGLGSACQSRGAVEEAKSMWGDIAHDQINYPEPLSTPEAQPGPRGHLGRRSWWPEAAPVSAPAGQMMPNCLLPAPSALACLHSPGIAASSLLEPRKQRPLSCSPTYPATAHHLLALPCAFNCPPWTQLGALMVTTTIQGPPVSPQC